MNLDKDTLDVVYHAIRERYNNTPDDTCDMQGIKWGLMFASDIVGVMQLGLAINRLEELVLVKE